MQSNDARNLVSCAVPTAATGVVAAVISGVLAGGKGVIGAAFGAVIVIAFMGIGLVVLQGTAQRLPHLFQAMGLMLYTTQLLLLAILLALFKHTTLFNLKAFAFTLLASTIVWITAQTRSYLKAKILYVEPESTGSPS
jgi:ATP synthase protein I